MQANLVPTAHSRTALSPLAKETVFGKLTMEGGGEGALGTSPGENQSLFSINKSMISPVVNIMRMM